MPKGRQTSNLGKYTQRWMQKNFKSYTNDEGQPKQCAKGQAFLLKYQGKMYQICSEMNRGRLRWRKRKVSGKTGQTNQLGEQISVTNNWSSQKLVPSFIRAYDNDPEYAKFFQKNGSPTELAVDFTFTHQWQGEYVQVVAKGRSGERVWARDHAEKKKAWHDQKAKEKIDRREQMLVQVADGDTGKRLSTFHASTAWEAIENDGLLRPNCAHPGGMFHDRSNSSDIEKMYLGK